MKQFGGKVLFLDRSDINTDEIIPAKYLTEVTKDALQPYLLEDLSLEGFSPNGPELQEAKVIVTRDNFGCGSSREHAPWALEVNDITVVIAGGYARIFRQNMFNCGMVAIELDSAALESVFALVGHAELSCNIDLEKKELIFSEDKELLRIPFQLNQFDEALVRAGGWVEYADANY